MHSGVFKHGLFSQWVCTKDEENAKQSQQIACWSNICQRSNNNWSFSNDMSVFQESFPCFSELCLNSSGTKSSGTTDEKSTQNIKWSTDSAKGCTGFLTEFLNNFSLLQTSARGVLNARTKKSKTSCKPRISFPIERVEVSEHSQYCFENEPPSIVDVGGVFESELKRRKCLISEPAGQKGSQLLSIPFVLQWVSSCESVGGIWT